MTTEPETTSAITAPKLALHMLKDLNERYENYLKVLGEITQDDIFEAFQPFFQAFPKVRYVAWTETTPAFNDGDPCTNSRGEFWVGLSSRNTKELNEVDDFALETTEFLENNAASWDKMQRVKGMCKAFNELTELLSEDLILHLFGTNSLIVVTPDKLIHENHYEGY